MLSSTQIAVSRLPNPPLSRALHLLLFLFLIFVGLRTRTVSACPQLSSIPRAQSRALLSTSQHSSSPIEVTSPPEAAILRLADSIATIPALHGPLRLETHQDPPNPSTIPKDWTELLKRDLEKNRLQLTDDTSAPLLYVSATETPTRSVYVASIKIGDRDDVRISRADRASSPAAAPPTAPMRIELQLVFSSPDRILDASSPWNGAETGLLLLTYRPSSLTVLHIGETGQPKAAFTLSPSAAKPSRDPHAELNVLSNGVSVLVPGKSCGVSWEQGAEALCHTVKASWRPPTTLVSPCDATTWRLFTSSHDWTEPDLLQVVPDSSGHRETAPMLAEFPGPILATNGEQNPASALVVARNLRTGNYEVYKITLACGN